MLYNYGVLPSLLLPHLLSSLTDSRPSLNLLCHSKTDALFMQDGWKAVWSIPYVSVVFFRSLKQNFIAYLSSKVSSRPDCIFEIHQLWQSGFIMVYTNSFCGCLFESEIMKIGQSSHKMYNDNILKFLESATILNAFTKNLETGWMHHVHFLIQSEFVVSSGEFKADSRRQSVVFRPSGPGDEKSKEIGVGCLYLSVLHTWIWLHFYVTPVNLSLCFSCVAISNKSFCILKQVGSSCRLEI